jgi:UDP-N-acetylmuramyl pentapeptide synthase
MAALDAALPAAMRGGLWPCPDAVMPSLIEYLQPGDIVTVKGSRAGRIGRIVERLRAASAGGGE